MPSQHESGSGQRSRLGLGLALLVSAAAFPAVAQSPPDRWLPARPDSSAPSTLPAAASVTLTLNLAQCLDLAVQRQPRLAAQRASLAGAENGRHALDALRIAVLLPEYPFRRRQAALGVAAAGAGLEQVGQETAYAVKRTYLTVLYARQQEIIARGVVARLDTVRKAAKQQLDAGAEGVTDTDVKRAEVFWRLAKAKEIQASQGIKRGLAALKEAIGLGPEACLDVADQALPMPDVQPCRADVIAEALARRPELAQAALFAEVAALEVHAQGASSHRRLETFAVGSDIHSHTVPQGVHEPQYRPGAVAPEMPNLLAGTRGERVKHAQDLHARALAVVEATRNLIGLEADDAFLRWEEAARQLADARRAAAAADDLAKSLHQDFVGRLKVRIDDLLNAWVLASQAKAQYNEYLYRELVALADLERITAGGFCARLVEPAAPRPQRRPQKATDSQ